MGLFSSSKSSSSTTNFTENIDRRIAVDGQSQAVSGDGNSINVMATDHGSVTAAVSASTAATTVANQSLQAALSMAGAATKDALAAAQQSINAVAGVNRDSLSFASTVNRDSLTLAERGQTLIANNAAQSLGMVGNIVDLAFKANDAQSKRLSDAGAAANSLVSRAYETATGYQAEKQTADSKYMVIAGLVVVALVAMKAFGK